MPYNGQAYRIPCQTGGWNYNPNTDLIPPESMVDCLNINLDKGGRTTRGGITEVNETPITDAPQIMGVFQFKKINGNTFIITTTADGKIQKDYATELKTGLGSDKYSSFLSYKDNLYICNGYDVPQIWDGAAGTTSNMTLIPTDWTGHNFPKGMIKHGKGASEKIWAWGFSSEPGAIYASETGSADFTDAKVTKFVIDTGDGNGIVGMCEYGDRLIALGKIRPYLIDDIEIDVANWGYDNAQWKAGTSHQRVVVETPNDIYAMSDEGEIYSIITAQTYGDYTQFSITRPAFIDNWIRENVDLSKIDQFHGVYDSVLRALKFFVIRKTQTKIDTVLVFFIDRQADAGWTKHQFSDVDFASCSSEIIVSAGIKKIYTGGHNGHVYCLEASTLSDNGLFYYSGFTLPELTFDNPRQAKRYDKGWMIIKPRGTETIKINLSVDGEYIVGGAILIDENGNEIGDENGDIFGGGSLLQWTITSTGKSDFLKMLGYSLGIVGNRIQAEIFNNSINEEFFISQIIFDFIPLELIVG